MRISGDTNGTETILLVPPVSTFRHIPRLLHSVPSSSRCCPCHCFGIVFPGVLATCLGSLGFPIYSSTKERLYASLLGPTLRGPRFHSLYLSVTGSFSFAFPPMVPRQPPRSNVTDPAIALGSVFFPLLFQALYLLLFDQWPDACVHLRVLVVSLKPSNRWPHVSLPCPTLRTLTIV